jgi:receptor protein-tyrosine kinase
MEETTIDLRDLFKIIRRRKWIIVTITFISIFIGVIISFIPQKSIVVERKEELYKSTTSVVVGTFPDLESDNIKDITTLNQQIVQIYGAVAASRTVAEKTIEELSLDIKPDEFMNKIKVVTNAGAQVVTIYYADKEEGEQNIILNDYIKNFMKEAQNIYPTGKLKILDEPSKVERISEEDYIKLTAPKTQTNTQTQTAAQTNTQDKIKNKKPMFAIALVLGLMAGFGTAFVVEFFDDSLKKKEEAEEMLKLATLAIIPKEKSKDVENIKEAFRILRTNLQLKKDKIFTVSSASKEDGKTMVSVNLAKTFAEAGFKTLILDGNGRNSDMNKAFGLQVASGISEILKEEDTSLFKDMDSMLLNTNIKNLKILSWGNEVSNPADLLSKSKLEDVFRELKSKFNYIIIDTTAMVSYCDAQIFAMVSDGTLIVAAEGKTNKNDLNRMKELIDISEINVRGIVWNESIY